VLLTAVIGGQRVRVTKTVLLFVCYCISGMVALDFLEFSRWPTLLCKYVGILAVSEYFKIAPEETRGHKDDDLLTWIF